MVKLGEDGMSADLADLPTEGGLLSEMGASLDGVGEILDSLLEADLPADGSDDLTVDS